MGRPVGWTPDDIARLSTAYIGGGIHAAEAQFPHLARATIQSVLKRHGITRRGLSLSTVNLAAKQLTRLPIPQPPKKQTPVVAVPPIESNRRGEAEFIRRRLVNHTIPALALELCITQNQVRELIGLIARSQFVGDALARLSVERDEIALTAEPIEWRAGR
jgi:hypothetical protein